MRNPVLITACALALVACSSPPEAKYGQRPDDGVPANSASEERLKNGDKPKPAATAEAADPTQPYTTAVGAGGGSAATAEPATPAGKSGKPGKPGAKDGKDGKEKVSKAECAQTLDKYMDLALGGDSRLEGVPAEMIPQLKQQVLSQARGEKGDPCATEVVTRSQYNCAMGATSTAAWQRCMGK